MSQRDQILRWLQDGPVCGSRLYEARMPRYAARINELRQGGHEIESAPCRRHTHISRVFDYRLIPKED